jgi:hypothetical protein
LEIHSGHEDADFLRGNQLGPLCIAVPHLNHIIRISCNQVI